MLLVVVESGVGLGVGVDVGGDMSVGATLGIVGKMVIVGALSVGNASPLMSVPFVANIAGSLLINNVA